MELYQFPPYGRDDMSQEGKRNGGWEALDGAPTQPTFFNSTQPFRATRETRFASKARKYPNIPSLPPLTHHPLQAPSEQKYHRDEKENESIERHKGNNENLRLL